METDSIQSQTNPEKNLTGDKIKDGIKKRHSVTVLASPEIAYAFWRNFKNFPLFMKEIEEVTEVSSEVSHWKMKLDYGPDLEWDAKIIRDENAELIAWQSIGDAPLKQAGSVWFKKADRNQGTVVTLTLSYTIPGGKLTELASKMLGEDPDTLILTNLRRFKAFIETGEVPTTDGQPNGKDKEELH